MAFRRGDLTLVQTGGKTTDTIPVDELYRLIKILEELEKG